MNSEPITRASARRTQRSARRPPLRVEQSAQKPRGCHPGQRHASRAAARGRTRAQAAVGHGQVRAGAHEPPVLQLEHEGEAADRDLSEEAERVACEVVDVDEVGPLVVEKAREIALQGDVAEGVARPWIALREVVDDEPDPNAAIEKLGGLAQGAAPVFEARVDRDVAPPGLANAEAPGIGLGARVVERRPALHHVHHPRGAAGRRGRPRRRQGGEDTLSGGTKRVFAHEAGDGRQVLGVDTRQPSLCLFDAGRPGSAEAALAGVKDERGVVEDVNVACLERAEAEVVLFAVAEPEASLVEETERVEHLPLDVEAEADAGGNPGILASRDALDEDRERVEVVTRGDRVDLERPRQRHEGRVVGERRDRGHGRVGVGRGLELLEPSRR